ncbi:GAF domain-containing sensor histidine kinase [Haloglomus litoreum]|uniref:GAF domain-containing sensor histidine kinase n=1 Tax=Haloglomus litoreum TaxID=3034026 RepID=UPI0023E84EFA|nr:GAF domain-containing sensor histidine kinase [Haloglomus sp. DT116]
MTREAAPPDGGGDGECRERMLASLLDATQELMVARDADAIAQVAVDAARDRLGYELVGVHLLPDAPRPEGDGGGPNSPEGLVPIAWTEPLVALIGQDPPPTIEPGTGVAWESFEEGSLRVFDDLRTAEVELMDPETAFRSELHVPLGRHGILIVGSAEVDEFDAGDVYFARILAANTTAALENLAARRAIEAREQELARQNRRLEEFADVISHDLRNPLAVAQATIEMGLETGEAAEFEKTRDALDRMEALVDGLLTLAKEGRAVGDPEPVDVAAVAERAWETVETGGATLTTASVDLQADPARLRQLLENLLRNAVDHGADDPADLTVTVGPLEDGPGFVVADDGRGIPEKERDAVFEHGVSPGGGTGLGLTIVRTIAEAHGWSVGVEPSEDGGTRFVFRTAER